MSREEPKAWEAEIDLCTDIYQLLSMRERIERNPMLSGLETLSLLHRLQRRREQLELDIKVVELQSEGGHWTSKPSRPGSLRSISAPPWNS